MPCSQPGRLEAVSSSELVVSTDQPCILLRILLLTTIEHPEYMKFGSTCNHLVQSLLPFRLLCTNIEIKMYRTMILFVVLDGCETWPCALKQEHKWRVSENEMVRRIFGSKGGK
jgi:hypothetical protein